MGHMLLLLGLSCTYALKTATRMEVASAGAMVVLVGLPVDTTSSVHYHTTALCIHRLDIRHLSITSGCTLWELLI